jgi:hypothetical protein
VCGRLMIDSGAFTAHSNGKKISLDAYAEYLKRWRGCWDHAVTLDVIGDGKASAANTRKLHSRGLPVMPVFTRGDSLPEFDAMVADVGYVCVGGLVGLPVKAQLARVKMLQRRAAAAGGGIHALGIGSMATLRVARPYSADASSVSGAWKFGTVVYFDGREIRNVSLADTVRLTRDRDHLRAHGVDLAQLARTRRMPAAGQGRKELMRAMSLAYACADEVLKQSGPVVTPKALDKGTHLYASVGRDFIGANTVAELDTELHSGPHLYSSLGGDSRLKFVAADLDARLHAGTHLYSSLTPDFALDPAAGLDSDLHSNAELPRIWRTYGRTHTCRKVPAR